MNESREQGPRRDGGQDAHTPAGRVRRNGRGPAARGAYGRWPRPAVAEQLLNDEDVTDADPRTAEMAGLLAAARTPPPVRPGDEAVALDAFRRTAVAPAVTGRRVPAAPAPAVRGDRRRTTRGPRTVRMLVGGALAVFALSGVAIAAQGGVLPRPFHFSGGGATHSPSVSASSPSPGTGQVPGRPPGRPHSPGAVPGPGTPGSPRSTAPLTVSPTPGGPADAGTRRLCEEYAKAKQDGTPPDAVARTRLARAAGGVNGIDAYCAALTAKTPGHGQKSAEPHPGSPSAAPTSSVASAASSAPKVSAAPGTSAPPGLSVQVTPTGARHR